MGVVLRVVLRRKFEVHVIRPQREQPPRKLSGTQDRKGDDTLESRFGDLGAGPHRRRKPGFFITKSGVNLSGLTTEWGRWRTAGAARP